MDIDLPTLQFNEPLAGSRVLKVDVLKQQLEVRLLHGRCLTNSSPSFCVIEQTLHKELQSFEQMNVDTSSLTSVSKDLINKRILGHKNTTVTALVTCCIADVLRLHAPDPPYDDAELQV